MAPPIRWICTLPLLLIALAAQADVPILIHYQGLLLDPNGVALNATVDVQAGVWQDPNSNDPNADLTYEELHSGVSVVDGILEFKLGGGTALSGAFVPGVFGRDQWLELKSTLR